MKPPVALAVSPHLDDAVFSAGGALARLAHAGWRVVVATVFTESVADPQGFALACQLDKGLGPEVDYMALRRAEDAKACAILGAEARWLPFREAPHRGYGSATELFGALRPDDRAAHEIAPSLAALATELQPMLVMGPQAIGGHVDHVAVIEACSTAFASAAMLWWRDYPYRWRNPDLDPLRDRFAALRSCTIRLSEDERSITAEAACAYASQLGFQFGGAAALRERLAREDVEESYRASRLSSAAAADFDRVRSALGVLAEDDLFVP